MNCEILREVIDELLKEKKVDDQAIEFAINVTERYLKKSTPTEPVVEHTDGISTHEISELVTDVQNKVVSFETAKQHLALFGWVLHDGYPVIAQAVKNRMCASCKYWGSPCFHMGAVDATCGITGEPSGDEDTCQLWESAIEGD